MAANKRFKISSEAIVALANGYGGCIATDKITVAGLPNFMQHYFNGLEPAPAATCALAELGLFPNPTADAFQVQLPATCFQPYTLTLSDALGRTVLTHTILTPANQRPFSVATLAAGLYVVEVRFAQQVVVKKLLKW